MQQRERMKLKFTEEEKEKIVEQWKAAEARVMENIKKRMIKLSKDKKLRKQIEVDINATLKGAI